MIRRNSLGWSFMLLFFRSFEVDGELNDFLKDDVGITDRVQRNKLVTALRAWIGPIPSSSSPSPSSSSSSSSSSAQSATNDSGKQQGIFFHISFFLCAFFLFSSSLFSSSSSSS